ncbi:hypothetical protein KAU32_12630 [bacterium]|nr:hypothetical protein [bacterium]
MKKTTIIIILTMLLITCITLLGCSDKNITTPEDPDPQCNHATTWIRFWGDVYDKNTENLINGVNVSVKDYNDADFRLVTTSGDWTTGSFSHDEVVDTVDYWDYWNGTDVDIKFEKSGYITKIITKHIYGISCDEIRTFNWFTAMNDEQIYMNPQ